MSKPTMTVSQLSAYAPEIQETLKKQFDIIADPVEIAVEQPVVAPQSETAAMPNLLLQGVDDNNAEDEPAKSDLFANIYVCHNGKRYRLTYVSLDSDFVRYTSKEKTSENGIRNAIVAAVESVGVEGANEKLTFEVELTKTGHTQTLDLLA